MSKTQLYGQKINPYFGERLSGENYLIMFCAEEADGFWQVSEGCASDIDTCIMLAALEPEESFAKGHCAKIFTPDCKEKKNYTSRDALIEDLWKTLSDVPMNPDTEDMEEEYQRNDICIELVGRVTYYAVPVAWFLPFGDNELVGRLDSESGDLGNMAIHIQDIINVYVLNILGNGFAHRNVELYPFEEAEEILSSMEKEGKADNFTFPLYEKYILIFENIYVYEDCRNKGCFTALMKMLYEYYGDSLTWICNTMPIFLDEDEYDEDKPEALYDLPDDLKDAKTKSQIEFNKKLLRKYDHTNTVFLDSEIPYVIRDNFFMQDKKEIEEASSYTATYKE